MELNTFQMLQELIKQNEFELLLPEDNAFRSLSYPYTKGDVALAVVINSPNIPNALAFVDHIME